MAGGGGGQVVRVGEEGPADDEEADDSGQVLGDDVVDEAHSEAELQEAAQVGHQPLEGRQHRQLLALVAAVEGHLLGVGDQPRVDVAQLALQLLLRHRQPRHGPPQPRQQHARQEQVQHHHARTLSTKNQTQFSLKKKEPKGLSQVFLLPLSDARSPVALKKKTLAA